jgi:predicted nuclease of predicted toxin-antitoxin system
MLLQDYPFLADENINPLLVKFLAEEGVDIIAVNDIGLATQPDHVILAEAMAQNRVVLTLDSDFGELTIKQGQPFVGIVYMRPGHLPYTYQKATLDAVLAQKIDVESSFTIVAERKNVFVKVRIRQVNQV